MLRTTNMIIPLAAILLVIIVPPGNSWSCDWDEPVAVVHSESPAWFVSLLGFLHAERIEKNTDARDTTPDRHDVASSSVSASSKILN